MARKKSFFTLTPLKSRPKLSVCIPAYNEEGNIGRTIDTVSQTLSKAGIPYEFVIANDSSKDNTKGVILSRMEQGIPIRLINRPPPGGFGRAVRSCLEHFKGDLVVIVMADMSDDPEDIVRYYQKINEGYDAIFGSRFMKGSTVTDYPRVKLIANRIGNKALQLLFRTQHNDLTNSFKMYRAEAVRSVMPLFASHFNLTIELSLGVLVRRFSVGQMSINWYGRTWGRANFRIKELGRRYLATLLKIYAERIFIHDDVISEASTQLKSHSEEPGVDIITNITYEENTDNGGSRVCGF
jgi:dolichol-phosphate mannosyltransferase